MKKKITIISLTFNNLENTTRPFLQSLYAHTPADMFELILVDNNSTDGTVEFLQEFVKIHDNAQVICNCENLGYAKGCNQAIKLAKYEFIGLLNNDILLSQNWLSSLFEMFEKEQNNVGLVSPCAIYPDNCDENRFNKYTEKLLLKRKSDYIQTIKPDFSCVVCRKQDIYKVGLFDENFITAYFEDDDLSWRFIFAGYTNYVSHLSYIYHKGSLTGKTLNNVLEIYQQNKKYFYKKYSDKYFVRVFKEKEEETDFLKSKILSYKKKRFLYQIKKFF